MFDLLFQRPHGEGCECGLELVSKAARKTPKGSETILADDPYITDELSLFNFLNRDYKKRFKKADVKALLLKAAKANSLTAIDEALAVADLALQKVKDLNRSPDLDKIITTSMRRGVMAKGNKKMLDNLKNAQKFIVPRYRSLVEFYMDNYFTRIVHPTVFNSVEANAKKLTGLSMREFIEKKFKQGHFDASPYWRLVANNTIVKTHTYGALKGAQLAGYGVYKFVAVLDKRTTPVCRAMNGKQWWVADGISLMEAAADANPEEAKLMTPWVTDVDDIKGKTPGQLAAAGIMLPPLHAMCRSTITAIKS